jgi:hypothetical protein
MSRKEALLTSTIVSFAVHAAAVGAVLRPLVPEPREIEIDPVPALAGETFEVPSYPATPTATAAAAAPAIETSAPRPEVDARRTGTGQRGPSSASLAPIRYGAVGERGTTDIVVAFGRAIAQVASADPEWITASFGDTGAAGVTLTIDDAGALVHAVVGGETSPQLRRAVERTIAFIKGRTFTASAPEVHLRVRARVSPDVVHDGLHGDVFALGASSDGHTAFFALSVGRRVDFDVDVTR